MKDRRVANLARLANTTPKVVRYFLNEELIDLDQPATAAKILLRVFDLRTAGFSLAEARASLPLLDAVDASQTGQLKARILRHIEANEALMATAQTRLKELDDLLREIEMREQVLNNEASQPTS